MTRLQYFKGCSTSIPDNSGIIPLETIALLMPESQLPAWAASTQLAKELLDLDVPQREIVMAQMQQRLAELPSSNWSELASFFKDTFTFPPIDREHLHCKPCMRKDNDQLIVALVGATNPLGPVARALRVGELPEFGELISEAGMNSDVYA